MDRYHGRLEKRKKGAGMKPKSYVGIDPGQTGAIAIVGADGRVEIHDYPGDERTLVDLCRSIHLAHNIANVIIELQQPRPGMNVSTMFKLGMNYASWLTACAAFDWPLRAVRPTDWKNGLGYPPKDPKRSKAHSLTLARRLYPSASDLLARTMDHNRAEALLLAHLAKYFKSI